MLFVSNLFQAWLRKFEVKSVLQKVFVAKPYTSVISRYYYYYYYYYYYLLTPCNRVLLEKLTGFQLVKKFSAFYGARSFITAFTGARHLPLS